MRGDHGGDFKLESHVDGFWFHAHRVDPVGPRRGGLVLLHEIFGVNRNIRTICDEWAAQGFEVIAPHLFDRTRPCYQGRADEAGTAEARGIAEAAPWPTVMSDVQACIDHLEKPVFLMGFSWGGSAAWLAGARCYDVTAAACFYGRLIATEFSEKPDCPVILHFGGKDPSIPLSDVEYIRQRCPDVRADAAPVPGGPDVRIFVYDDAGHGFMSDRPGQQDAAATVEATRHTFNFFEERGAVPEGAARETGARPGAQPPV